MLRRIAVNADPMRIIWIAPILLVLHVLEEALGLVPWVNALVINDISQEDFWVGNTIGLVITVLVVVFAVYAKKAVTTLLALAWFSFFMLGNVFAHIGGTIIVGRYMPGVITAILFFLPYYSWLLWLVIKRLKPGRVRVVLAVLAGLIPMLVHAHRVILEGKFP